MIRLGLIGKDIAHSQSPRLYQKLLGPSIRYDILDIASSKDLPSLEELSKSYYGINITAPWKSFYLDQVVIKDKRWPGINCLSFREAVVEGTNTDASALVELIEQMKERYRPHSWVILGDGVMGKIVAQLLKAQGLVLQVFARSKGDDLSQLNLSMLGNAFVKMIVVNTCSRDFNFKGKLDARWVFWDLNYAHAFHERELPGQCHAYVDGFELLETQAQHAVKFWELQDINSTLLPKLPK